MPSDSASKVELLTALLMFLGLCWALYRIILGAVESPSRGSAPVRVNLWRRLRRALNAGRLQMRNWSLTQATVEQTYEIKQETFGTVVSRPKLGLRIINPF